VIVVAFAVCCSALQSVAVCCSMLPFPWSAPNGKFSIVDVLVVAVVCVTVGYSVLQCVAVCCGDFFFF